MKKAFLILALLVWLQGMSKHLETHCENDSKKMESIVSVLSEGQASLGERIAEAAEMFVGAEYDPYYQTDSVGALRINMDSFTPLTLVNNSIALARTSLRASRPDINVFAEELENISCRRGDNAGFPSIMFHSSDWIGDNLSRGNITEITEDFAGVVARTKSLDEMTRNRQNFAALADSAVFETVRMTEMGFRTHRVPTLKKETIKKKEVIESLQDGDIIIFVPSRDGIDYIDMGILKFENGLPYLIHLSPQTKTVVKEAEELSRYMSLMTKYYQGYRIVRAKE